MPEPIKFIGEIKDIIRPPLPRCPHNLGFTWQFVFKLPLGFCPICAREEHEKHDYIKMPSGDVRKL